MVVLKRESGGDEDDPLHFHVVHLAVCHDFAELDESMKRFRVFRCVVDGLPETHATREFARRHRGRVYMCFFNKHQRSELKWDRDALTVQVNRTEALDASRAAVRERKVTLPRRVPIVETFARHMAADAKVLEEDEDTGAKRYKYVKTGEDHFSLAFTYARMAARHPGRPRVRVLRIAPRKREFSRDQPIHSWAGHLRAGRGLGPGISSQRRRW